MVGKRTGLSFAEINQLRIQDLDDYADIYFSASNQKEADLEPESLGSFFGLL